MWGKSWRECRSRFWVGMFFCVAATVLGLSGLIGSPLSTTPEETWMWYSRGLAFTAVLMTVNFAGSGINSQTAWGVMHGFHPSMYFLLSLPVSRTQALLVRSAVGWIQLQMVLFLSAFPFALLAPIRGMHFPVWMVAASVAHLAVGATALFGLMTFLTTLLDEVWAGLCGYMIAAGFFGYGGALFGVKRVFNPLAFMDGEAFHRTGIVMWSPVSILLIASAAFLWASALVVERKEY